MSPESLAKLLGRLIADWEGECVEFKDANDNFSTSDIGKYFSALSNEANLHGRDSAWLVFGVHNTSRAIIGTTYRESRERLHGLKKQIADGSSPSCTFRDIHELIVPEGRIVLFEIPPAPRGMPIGWNGHYFARNNESLSALSIAKLDEIRAQGAADDWSAVVCEAASLADLEPAAIVKAREIYLVSNSQRLEPAIIQGWDDATFLDKAKLTIRGGITRAALLLLGRDESTHLLNPHVAEMTWKLEGPEQDYAHFHPPFLLETSRLYQRIRNVRLRLERPGELIPVEFPKYEQRIVLEALHNCIAHQDYSRCERILVIERPGELVFQNAGGFYDGTPGDYVLGNRTPSRYRNRFLAEAMFNLRMMDTLGYGIREVMFRGQMARYLPLPDYDLSDPAHVTLHLPGRFIDENYSLALLAHSDFSIDEVLALDSLQKGRFPDDAILRALRKRGLVEGRKPAIHISATVAAASGQKASYITTRRQDDAHYRHLITDYLRQFDSASKDELRRMLANKWPDVLTPEQRENKLHNLLSGLRAKRRIERTGGFQDARWQLTSSDESGESAESSEN